MTPKKNPSGKASIAFVRGLQLGATNFWRNKFLSFATIVVMAIIIFIFNVILAIQFTGNQALQALSERVDIILYLQDDIDFFTAQRITQELKQVEGVTNVQFTSKEEALEIVAKTHPQTADFLEKFNLQNPLPPSISITTQNPEDHAKVNAYLKTSSYTSLLENYITESGTGQNVVLSSVAQNLENIGTFVRQIIFWMVFVFILGGTLVVLNAIQLTIYNRKNEIHIMRLVGATPNFIRMPYIVEAAMYATAAVLLSFVILLGLSESAQLEGLTFLTFYQNLNIIGLLITELAITLVLSIISSLSATEQHIKGKLILH